MLSSHPDILCDLTLIDTSVSVNSRYLSGRETNFLKFPLSSRRLGETRGLGRGLSPTGKRMPAHRVMIAFPPGSEALPGGKPVAARCVAECYPVCNSPLLPGYAKTMIINNPGVWRTL